MKILSKEISTKTQKHVEDICAPFRLPVQYFTIEKRPNADGQAAGSVDPYGHGGYYSVWLNEGLPKDAFETDLLHELRHIVQVESGFPSVFNKATEIFNSNAKPLIQSVGTKLASVVLDIDVNAWLQEIGYPYTFFSDNNARHLLSYPNAPLDFDNPFARAEFCLKLLHGSLYVSDAISHEIFCAHSSQAELSTLAQDLRTVLIDIEVNSPQSAALAQCLLIDALDLWPYYMVILCDRKIRTHKEYLDFRSETGCSFDMAR